MSDFEQPMDMNTQLMLDGNAVAGELVSLFGVEMTTASLICAQCGKTSVMGQVHAFTHAPGLVLRCPTCERVMIRVVQTPDGTLVDARGVMFLKIPS